MANPGEVSAVVHDAAVQAAMSNPIRRHGKAKTKTSLHQPLVTWHRLPSYLRDNEYIVGTRRNALTPAAIIDNG
jgi:hypothetical protein